jgi:hypothetical protein
MPSDDRDVHDAQASRRPKRWCDDSARGRDRSAPVEAQDPDP